MSRPRRDPRALTMPPGRRIPRPEPVRPIAPVDEARAVAAPAEIRRELDAAGAELSRLVGTVRSCQACGRCMGDRAFGSGYPRAPVMLLKERPSEADLASGAAFTSEAEALGKAFDRLRIPSSWIYGTCAVRCGDGSATAAEVRSCSSHLLVELEAVFPRVVVAFGVRAVDAISALHGRCGMDVPEDIPEGEPVPLRPGLWMIATEALPRGVTVADAKRRLWSHLQVLPGLLGA